MDRQQRIQAWADEPDCTPELAEAIVAMEDAEEEISRLQGLLYSTNDIHVIKMIERGTRKLAEVIVAESGSTSS